MSEFVDDVRRLLHRLRPGHEPLVRRRGRDRTHRTERPEARVPSSTNGDPFALTAGPDDALWFTNRRFFDDRPHHPRRRVPRDSRPSSRTRRRQLDHPRTGRQPLVHHGLREPSRRVNLAGTVDRIVTLEETSGVTDIVAGLDGGLWFTESSANKIGRVSSLAFLFTNLGDGAAPLALARGADDSIWFAAAGGNRVGRIGKDGSLVQFELGDGHTPVGVAVDADGNGWFTDQEANTIGRMTPDGELVEFPIPTAEQPAAGHRARPGRQLLVHRVRRQQDRPHHAAGIDHGVPDPDAVRRSAGHRRSAPTATSGSPSAAPTGSAASRRRACVTEFIVPTADTSPFGIAAGPDGNLYFTEYTGGRVARITTAGVITELGIPISTSYPQYIALGPDGAMWFTENGANRLGRVTTHGRVTKFNLPMSDTSPPASSADRRNALVRRRSTTTRSAPRPGGRRADPAPSRRRRPSPAPRRRPARLR